MGTDQNGTASSLRASRLFGALDPAGVQSLLPHVRRRRFTRGTSIWRAGEEASCMALIASGLVKIVQPGGAIVAILGPHETFGELAIVGGTTYWADAVAATRELDVLFVDAAAVRAASQSDAAFARALGRSLVEHGRALHEKIRIMSAGCVERRVAALLRHLLERFGDELEDGSAVIPITLSRAELSCLVGATIETTIRTMSKLHKNGTVSTTDEGFLVHSPKRLEAILGQDVTNGSWSLPTPETPAEARPSRGAA
jgi:CRP-like cAMP-binding protein